MASDGRTNLGKKSSNMPCNDEWTTERKLFQDFQVGFINSNVSALQKCTLAANRGHSENTWKYRKTEEILGDNGIFSHLISPSLLVSFIHMFILLLKKKSHV